MGVALSIITVNLNNRKGLLETAASIKKIRRNGDEIEAHLIDGGSSDLSNADWDYLSLIFDSIESEKDRGIFDAMNKGLKKANASHAMMLNSGDLLREEMRKHFSLIRFQRNTVYVYNWVANERVCHPKPISDSKYGYFPFNHQAMIIPAEFQYDANLKFLGDLDLLLYLSNIGLKFEYVNVKAVDYEGGGVSSKRSVEKLKEKFAVIKKHCGFIGLLKAGFVQGLVLIGLTNIGKQREC